MESIFLSDFNNTITQVLFIHYPFYLLFSSNNIMTNHLFSLYFFKAVTEDVKLMATPEKGSNKEHVKEMATPEKSP